MDLSHFKKVSQDKKLAVLLHPDGHEIKIAISGLNPSMKEKLEKMPLHQAEGSFAPIVDMDASSPEETEETTTTTETSPEGASVPPVTGETKEVAPPTTETTTTTVTPEKGMAPPASTATTQPPPATPVKPEEPAAQAPAAMKQEPKKPDPLKLAPEQEAAAKTAETLKYAQDLNFNHIQPKTYADLYNNKSTMGKIGTIFGLLVAGAGAGLTHQKNAVIEMMDNQIKNDLEAQKTDQSNKQNWYKISLEHVRNTALNELTNSETLNNLDDHQKKLYINGTLGITKDEATANAYHVMAMNQIQEQQLNINRMPPGPTRDNAQAKLNDMAQGLQKKIYDDYLGIATKKQNLMSEVMKNGSGGTKPFNPPPAKGPADPNIYYSAVNDDKLNKAINIGKVAPEAPGAIPPGEVQTIMDEKKKLESHRDVYANAEKAFKILDQIKNSGQVPSAGALSGISMLIGASLGSLGGPIGTAAGGGAGKVLGEGAAHGAREYYERLRNVVMDSLIGQLDPNKGNDERKRIAESMMPSWTDDAKSRALAHKELYQQFASSPNEKAPNLDRYGLKTKMPQYEYNPGERLNTTKEDISDLGNKVSDKIAETFSGSKNSKASATAAEAQKKGSDGEWWQSAARAIGIKK